MVNDAARFSNVIHGRVVALSVSRTRGIPKSNVESVRLISNWGVEGDAHAGAWHRQVSLLASESIEKMRGLGVRVRPGIFAENITTEGIDIPGLRVGDRIVIGESELEITQIGKECHDRCAIYYQAGDCVMPKEGVFAIVLRSGSVRVGDAISVSSVTPHVPNEV